jgi:predicted thioredoxin/glutaredoxin
MKIDIYLSEQCGSYYKLLENIERAIAETQVPVDLKWRTMYYDDAVALGIKGSPTIWINGKDAFPGGNDPGLT